MRRIVLFVLVIALCLSTAMAESLVEVNCNSRVFAQPDVNSFNVAIPKGLRVTLVETNGAVAKIALNGVQGYTLAAHLSPVDDTPVDTTVAEMVIARATKVYANPSDMAASLAVPAGLRVIRRATRGGWAYVTCGSAKAFIHTDDLTAYVPPQEVEAVINARTFVYAQPNGSAAKIAVPAGLRVMVTEVNSGWAKVRNGAYYAFMAVTDLSTPEAYQAAVQVKPTEPTNGKRLEGIVIGIDPGHQAHADNGQEPIAPGSIETKDRVAPGTAGVVTRVNEYEVDLNISLQLRDALIAQGATVVMTRQTNDVNISNMERALLMNGSGVNLVLRLHCNGSSNHDDNGIGLYVTKTGGIADASYMAAEKILPYMTAATGARRDGIFKRDSYTGLNWSTVPAILVEMGYMSNPAEDMKLNDPAYQAQLVNGMVEGICACFGR